MEPSPNVFPALLRLHCSNPKIQLVNCAIGVKDEWLEFYDSNGDGVSSSNLAHVAKWANGSSVKFTKFLLRSVGIDEFFKKFGYDFQFLNLDVEMLNWELFQLLPFKELASLKVICVEHDRHFEEMANLVAPFGFTRVALNGENAILARP